MRVGQGFDAHRLVAGRPLRLGGIEVPHDRGLEGHSDGDALRHALASALLGAAGEGDLGTLFPSSDASLESIDSARILEQVALRVRARGFEIGNVDATLIAQAPRLAAFLPRMAEAIAGALSLPRERVNVKVSSTDQLGALGREEGIAALAVVLLEESDSA